MTHEEAVRTAELIRTLEDKKGRLEDWIDSLKDQRKGYMTEQGLALSCWGHIKSLGLNTKLHVSTLRLSTSAKLA